MAKLVYGVDLSKKITPIIVRDAILVCFKQAHKDVLDSMDEYAKWTSKEERESFRNLETELLIKNAFKEAGVDFDNPTKDELIVVIKEIAKLGAMFRNKEIVKTHYIEIRHLIDKIE